MADKAYYRRQLVDLRLRISKEREAKKHDNEYYARQIRSTSSASSKASYRKAKIMHSDRHNRNIEALQRQVEGVKRQMANCR